MRLNVYFNTWGKKQLLGRLDDSSRHIVFQYSPGFLQTGIPVSPLMLPLVPGPTPGDFALFEGLPGLCNDSLPDGWGKLLVDRQLQKLGIDQLTITPLQRLAIVGTRAMGALEYEPVWEELDTKGREKRDAVLSEETLARLAAASRVVLAREVSEVLDELWAHDGSSTGARPKIVVLVSANRCHVIQDTAAAPAPAPAPAPDGYEPWIIKFPSSSDAPDVGAVEYAYSLRARAAGRDMPPTCLFPSRRGEGYFGVRRFDRWVSPQTGEIQKVHMHTASGLLNASFRIPSLDYENLLQLTTVLTRDEREVRKMARLMIFNVKAGNRDDHAKNFSFLLDRDLAWRLSPAYDLTPSRRINGEHTAMVNGKGSDITDDDLIMTAGTAGIPAEETRRMYEEVAEALG